MRGKRTAVLSATANYRGQQGMVLILTLWVLAILSFLLLSVMLSVNLNSGTTLALKQQSESNALARGAIYAMINHLAEIHQKKQPSGNTNKQSDKDSQKDLIQGKELGFYQVDLNTWRVYQYDQPASSQEVNPRQEGKIIVICQVLAEDAKAPLNTLTKQNLIRIPGITENMAGEILKQKDKIGGNFSCLEELLSIDRIKGAVYDGNSSSPGLKNILSPFSEGKLFINRASAEAITATLDIDNKKAIAIAATVQNKNYFLEAKELETFSGISMEQITSTISFTCQVYRIKAYIFSTGNVNELEAVVDFKQQDQFQIVFMGTI